MNSNDQTGQKETNIFENPFGQTDQNNVPKEDNVLSQSGETPQTNQVNTVPEEQQGMTQPVENVTEPSNITSNINSGVTESVSASESVTGVDMSVSQQPISNQPVESPVVEESTDTGLTDVEKNAVSLDQAMPATWNLDPSQLANDPQSEPTPASEPTAGQDVASQQPAPTPQQEVVQPSGDQTQMTPQPEIAEQPNNAGVTPMPTAQKPQQSLKSRTNNTVGIVIGIIVVVALIVGGYFVLDAFGILGANTLTCTTSTEENGGKTEMSAIYKFKDDKPSVVTVKGLMTLSSSASDEEKQAFQFATGIMEMSFSSADGQDGVTYDSNMSDTKYDFELEVDTEKINGGDLSNTAINIDTSATKETIKKELEEQGFTCK